jgi:hypothetical protein
VKFVVRCGDMCIWVEGNLQPWRVVLTWPYSEVPLSCVDTLKAPREEGVGWARIPGDQLGGGAFGVDGAWLSSRVGRSLEWEAGFKHIPWQGVPPVSSILPQLCTVCKEELPKTLPVLL